MDLSEICQKKLVEKGLADDKRFKKVLKWELEETIAKKKTNYFLDLFQRKVRYPNNQNNLLICWLLGIVSDYDIEAGPRCVFTGDLPDIDIDYIEPVREYLKNVWAPKTFGQEYVCNIGSYMTFGVKSSLVDMARVHSESSEEVHAVTKDIALKDDEGHELTWDSAIRIYPELQKYCEAHPDIAKAAKKLVGRNRTIGQHAAGLIISSIPLSDFLPLVRQKDKQQASAWPEGLKGKDLQPVGLVKFDLLVLSNLMQIALCCELVKKRHNLAGICAKPGQPDWSDVPKWRNDPKALEMAARGDLNCIFQFDKESVQAMARACHIDRFEDMVALTSLNRPGPMLSSLHTSYIERKNGREKYSIHPILKPILETTYGIVVYQEQLTKILNVVGEIPLEDCEVVRNAISKKKIEGFLKYKNMFLENGKKNLGYNDKEINDFFNLLCGFSEYAFNLCLDGDVKVFDKLSKNHYSVEDLAVSFKNKTKPEIYLDSYKDGEIVKDKVVDVFETGEQDVYEIELTNGIKLSCTLNHKFLCSDGEFYTVEDIHNKDLEILWKEAEEMLKPQVE